VAVVEEVLLESVAVVSSVVLLFTETVNEDEYKLRDEVLMLVTWGAS
jgi:hypothetical protein